MIKPYPLAMIICDAVWRDPHNGKMTILGTFGQILAPTFPLEMPRFAVLLTLTGGHGVVPISFRLVDADESIDSLAQVETEIDFPDPLSVLETVSFLDGVIFTQPGEYRLQCFSGSEMVIERRIMVFDGSAGDYQ